MMAMAILELLRAVTCPAPRAAACPAPAAPRAAASPAIVQTEAVDVVQENHIGAKGSWLHSVVFEMAKRKIHQTAVQSSG